LFEARRERTRHVDERRRRQRRRIQSSEHVRPRSGGLD
jgi:hypothetical protein